MNLKNIWLWVLCAAGLFAFIFLVQPRLKKPDTGPARILPRLKAATVPAVQVMLKGQPPIRAERVNGTWQLSKPVPWPAQATNIDLLLTVLEQLTPARHVSETELTNRFSADKDFGFSEPQATLIIEQGDCPRLRFGMTTPPGDQVFLQVVGLEGIYVVDAVLLKLIPRSDSDWRDRTLLHFNKQTVDRVAVTSGNKSFTLQSQPTNHLWRMTAPFEARANNAKINESLEALEKARILQFVSDEPRTDWEALGLQPPELELDLAQGTNHFGLLQFGKNPTNDAQQVYARRAGQSTLFTVSKDLLSSWRTADPVNSFRDPHLLVLLEPVETIAVRGEDSFWLQRQTNNAWHVMPQNFPADAQMVNELLTTLTDLEVGVVQDNVTELGLTRYGLTSPRHQYILQSAGTNLIVSLSFGTSTNQEDVVYAQRADERSVYAVKLADFQRLPTSSLQFRQRRLWHFTEDNVARLTVRLPGKERQLIRNGPASWSLAPGSQGVINNQAVEQTLRSLCKAAPVWIACGEQHRASYGITENSPRIILELKNGNKAILEFGKEAPSTFPYAAVTLEGQTWILEFPWPFFLDWMKQL